MVHGCDLISSEMGFAQRDLGFQRDKLRVLLGGNGKKQKISSCDSSRWWLIY